MLNVPRASPPAACQANGGPPDYPRASYLRPSHGRARPTRPIRTALQGRLAKPEAKRCISLSLDVSHTKSRSYALKDEAEHSGDGSGGQGACSGNVRFESRAAFSTKAGL